MPSFEFIESFGMTALEAMACGIPVVASRNGGLTEVVADGYCGMLVNAGDVQALADAIQRYIDEPGLCREHGARARHHCETSFDVRDRAERYITLLGW
jgi:glycosyltransferase involved in cell wall biosynthesis